jgi:serine/threonine protein kinase
MKPLEHITGISKGKFAKNKRIYQAYLGGKSCILKVYKEDEKIHFDHELAAYQKIGNNSRFLTLLDSDSSQNLLLLFEDSGTRLWDIKANKSRALDYLLQAVNSLIWIHSNGIIHRDIYPNNLLIKNDKLRIIDFGISYVAGLSESIKTYYNPYFSRSQEEQELLLPESDIYGLGASFLVCFGLISPILKDMTEHKPQDRPRLDEVKKILLEVG